MSQSGRGGSPNGSPGRRSAGRRRTALRAAAILFALALGASPWLVWRALQAPRVPVPPRAPRVLRDVTVIEPGRSRRRHRDLVIADGRIRTERASHARVDGDGGSGGGFVLPGLIDLHVHYPPRVAAGNAELWSLLFLAHGVTSLRETGSIDGSIFEVRREIRAGRTPGPRIFACGPMLDGDPPSFPSNRVVRSAADADRAVDALAADGADCVKVYNMLSREALHAIHRAAKRHALPVIGHKPHAVSLEEAHISDLQHLTGAPEVDVERVARQDFRFEDWWTVDERRMQYVERVSLAQGIAYTPTLVNAHLRALLLDPSRANGDSGLRHL
ncbi:MAG: amidohydrolase family protein, partial [Deltaproteobacteria bacterium]